jgi:3-methylcrotonyl-CoA carboxylase alpha subunit
MGDKSAAKALMESAGVPVVPGYHGADQSDARLSREADRIGYPVMIKAAGGGGGKGMRAVGAPAEFAASLAAARREARSAFGDERMLVEKHLASPRHIEVQVFADAGGRIVHLFERDCSVQRRHQKIIEEAPAPGMTPERREAMCAAAVAAARAVGYLGAGTVEFIVDEDGHHYFMEMNTRLQVEHPVTELITGQDLVEWQLRVAAGGPLPARQEELSIRGHAIEARLYAEDPGRGFLPATGRLTELRFPAEGDHLRVDTGVQTSDDVGIHYDPLLAKVIVWDRDRGAALRRLQAALRDTRVAGVRTNLEFLSTLAAHEAFARGAVDTGFIDRHRDELLGPSGRRSHVSTVPNSPWEDKRGWRLGAAGLSSSAQATAGAVPAHAAARADGDQGAGGTLTAPMPGRVVAVHVAKGQDVRRGEPLLVLEAMKMEHTVAAPADGVVREIRFAAGDLVEEGAELVVLG